MYVPTKEQLDDAAHVMNVDTTSDEAVLAHIKAVRDDQVAGSLDMA